ncbi:hypothetical protein HZH68_008794 [Vespula germanica]|uniref:Uncharacterized protein n=1 Tax=Vespula germanica TaxID=30212 RepID=A0A834K1D7_VESGE|nr:hypothetical protein HZH68_008794 [Vespula germanica]
MVWAGVRVGEVLGEASGRQAAAAPAPAAAAPAPAAAAAAAPTAAPAAAPAAAPPPATAAAGSARSGKLQLTAKVPLASGSMLPPGRPTSKRNSGSSSIEGSNGWRPPPTTTTLKKWWPWWLLLPGCFASWTKYVEEYDSIRVARCDARCGDNHPDEAIGCTGIEDYDKGGEDSPEALTGGRTRNVSSDIIENRFLSLLHRRSIFTVTLDRTPFALWKTRETPAKHPQILCEEGEGGGGGVEEEEDEDEDEEEEEEGEEITDDRRLLISQSKVAVQLYGYHKATFNIFFPLIASESSC